MLAQEHEQGHLSDGDYESLKAAAIEVVEVAYRATGRLVGDGWSVKRSPPAPHYPNGYSACWWKGPLPLPTFDDTKPIRSVQVVTE